MVANNMRINTPPADDRTTSVSFDSTSTRWSSPSRRQASRARVLRSTRQRRRTRNRSESDPFILPGPLSQLTKHMTHIPIKDMEAYVNRPLQERRSEVTKKNKVPRPMNSFMLYRSAYTDRTKEYFKQQNHQVVSSAAGNSWNQETPEIRQKYERLSLIEKQNHMSAHPGYKFTPSKDKKKRSGLDDDPTYHGYRSTPEGSPAPHHLSQLSTLSTPAIGSHGWDSGHPTPELVDHGLPTDGYFPSSWPTSHPAQAPNSSMLTSESAGYMHQPHPEEMQYISSTLAGLPGAAHHDLLQPQGQMAPPGGQVDPQLLDYPGAPMNPETGNHVYGNAYPPIWQESNSNMYAPYEQAMEPSPSPYSGAALQPGMQTLNGHEAWNQTPADPSGGEFENWINHPQGY
ncbi:hypothetical protein BDV18DRAFT_6707 [Aspergillus unguis]